jgi:hypothetical protein
MGRKKRLINRRISQGDEGGRAKIEAARRTPDGAHSIKAPKFAAAASAATPNFDPCRTKLFVLTAHFGDLLVIRQSH